MSTVLPLHWPAWASWGRWPPSLSMPFNFPLTAKKVCPFVPQSLGPSLRQRGRWCWGSSSRPSCSSSQPCSPPAPSLPRRSLLRARPPAPPSLPSSLPLALSSALRSRLLLPGLVSNLSARWAGRQVTCVGDNLSRGGPRAPAPPIGAVGPGAALGRAERPISCSERSTTTKGVRRAGGGPRRLTGGLARLRARRPGSRTYLSSPAPVRAGPPEPSGARRPLPSPPAPLRAGPT